MTAQIKELVSIATNTGRPLLAAAAAATIDYAGRNLAIFRPNPGALPPAAGPHSTPVSHACLLAMTVSLLSQAVLNYAAAAKRLDPALGNPKTLWKHIDKAPIMLSNLVALTLYGAGYVALVKTGQIPATLTYSGMGVIAGANMGVEWLTRAYTLAEQDSVKFTTAFNRLAKTEMRPLVTGVAFATVAYLGHRYTAFTAAPLSHAFILGTIGALFTKLIHHAIYDKDVTQNVTKKDENKRDIAIAPHEHISVAHTLSALTTGAAYLGAVHMGYLPASLSITALGVFAAINASVDFYSNYTI